MSGRSPYKTLQAFQEAEVRPMGGLALSQLRSHWLRDCQAMEAGRGVKSQLMALAVGGCAVFPASRRDEIMMFVRDQKLLPDITMRFEVSKCGAGLRVDRIV